jgi:hypothetical protein
VKKSVKFTAGIGLIFLLFITFVISGCVKDLYATDGRMEQERQEKSQEEIEQEKKEKERLRLEEEERKRKEREAKEEALKEALGPFYVPLPPEEQIENPPVKARGLYITGNTVGLTSKFSQLVEMVETTELNALVIDVKNDHGLMTYPSQIEIVKEVGANRNAPVKNMQEVIADLNSRGIYTIARIVVFKDPHLPEQKPEWALHKKTGGVWRDNKGVAWVNPYEQKVWDYNIAIAKEAALMGFKEIQFDYIRFPENARRVDLEVNYGENVVAKDEIIEEFLAYAREQLKDYNVHLAADVFGVIATSWGDNDKIGQTWERMTAQLEYICPMIYPSHYGPGYFGFKVPDANPYGTVREALIDSLERNASVKNPGIIRPWLQSFTASWVPGNIKYGAQEVRKQIDAALELGIDEYLIWNASNRYIKEAFLTEEQYQSKAEQLAREREEKGLDALGKTQGQALEDLLHAWAKKDWRKALYLHADDFTLGFTGYRPWVESWTGKVSGYAVKGSVEDEGRMVYTVDVTISYPGEKTEITMPEQKFTVNLENNIWRIKPSQEVVEALTAQPAPSVEEDKTETHQKP